MVIVLDVSQDWHSLSSACDVISTGVPCSRIAFISRNFLAFPVTNTVKEFGYCPLVRWGLRAPNLCISAAEDGGKIAVGSCRRWSSCDRCWVFLPHLVPHGQVAACAPPRSRLSTRFNPRRVISRPARFWPQSTSNTRQFPEPSRRCGGEICRNTFTRCSTSLQKIQTKFNSRLENV